MPYVVQWTGKANQGLERAYQFLAEKNEEVAIAAIKAIREAALLLQRFPHAGRPAEDLNPEHREILIPFGSAGYVLLYHFGEDKTAVTVLAIRHQKEVGY